MPPGFPLGKMKKSYSNTLDWDVDPGCSSGCVYGMVEALEDPRKQAALKPIPRDSHGDVHVYMYL